MSMDALAAWIDRRKQPIINNCYYDQPKYRRWLATTLLSSIEWIERVIFCHHNADVLIDTEHRLSCLLDHATGGHLSKPGYDFETMRIWVDDYISENFTDNDDAEVDKEDAIEEAMEPYTVLRPMALYNDNEGPVLWWVTDLAGKAHGKPYAGRPTDIDFPQIGGMCFTTIPLPNPLQIEAALDTLLVRGDAAPAITRGASEGFAGDADAPR